VGWKKKISVDINMRTLIGRIFFIIILCLAGFWILSLWNIPVGLPVATVGIITLALTVAIQDILKDLVAGSYILIERPLTSAILSVLQHIQAALKMWSYVQRNYAPHISGERGYHSELTCLRRDWR
jgi:hypothetical protein